MSGVAAILALDGAPVDVDALRRMVEAGAHRGPDGRSSWVDGCIGLAHLALHATPEALRERQPLASEDGLVRLTADARIDNREELLAALAGEAHLDGSATDADLILAAYRRWGTELARHLIGDFAVVLWDGRERRLLCARDHLGVKPLHWSRVGQVLCVASEAQQILQHPAVPRRLDEVAIADYLVNNCDDEERTMFLDVSRLPPAHLLIASRDGVRIERYWDPDPKARIRYRRDEDYAAHYLELFSRAVHDRLRTQAPVVAIELSGGLDSSSVVAVARRELASRQGAPRVVAFSLTFETLASCDERRYSLPLARELGVDIHCIDAEAAWINASQEDFQPDIEGPFLGWGPSTHALLRRASELGAGVVLTGHAGLYGKLGSNPLVDAYRVIHGDRRALQELVTQGREASLSPPRALYWGLVHPLLPHPLRRLLAAARGRRSEAAVPEWLSRGFVRRTGLARRAARRSGLWRVLMANRPAGVRRAIALGSVGRAVYWYDRAAASHHVVARHPFLDLRLVELLLAVPPEQIFRFGRDRVVLREAMRGILPDSTRERQDKARFYAFTAFRLASGKLAPGRVFPAAPNLARCGIIDPTRLAAAWEESGRGTAAGRNLGALLFSLTLEAWLGAHLLASEMQ